MTAASEALPPDLADTVIVIPALNEAECIADTIAHWRRWRPLEIRVIDNGCTDQTVERAKAAGATVLTEPLRGYGAAAWRGLQSLPDSCRWVLFSSGDGSDRLEREDLELWRKEAEEGADFVVGDRISRPKSREALKAAQSFGNSLCCWVIRLRWKRTFRDMGSLRWIRRTCLERMDLRDRGFGWNIEMQVRAIEHGLKIVELPVDYHPRAAGKSKISGSFMGTIRAGIGILRKLRELS